jgi:predicted RNase H-like nuclease
MVFLGIDLGWYGKPTGLAAIAEGRLVSLARLERAEEIYAWIEDQARGGDAMAAVDAPLVIPNATGIREAERLLNADFRRHHAGCHASNQGLPFAARVTAFSRGLRERGFAHGGSLDKRANGRFQFEIHPHAASVALFGLERIIKYKRGLRAERARGLNEFRDLLLERLPRLDPPLRLELPVVPTTGDLKPTEDQIDAALCAYVALHYWHWGRERNRVYGSNESGYIVVPSPTTNSTRVAAD